MTSIDNARRPPSDENEGTVPGSSLATAETPKRGRSIAMTHLSANALFFIWIVVVIAFTLWLSSGYLLGLVNLITIGLLTKHHMDWRLVCLLMVVLGAFVGLVNGLIVTVAKISSFIATLGTGSILYAVGLWYSEGALLTGQLPDGFGKISSQFHGIPIPVIYVVGLTLGLFLLLEYTPAGRHFYVLGASERTARLLGIPTDRYVIASFMISGSLVAAAGLTLASLLRSASSNTGPEYLLPAFAAAFLGSTTFRPGRVNALGTLLAVVVLATVVNGLSLKGLDAWIQPTFNGVMLVGAVAVSGYLLRRREGSRRFARMRNRTSTID